MIAVRIKKLCPEVPTPVYKTEGSAGCDICASEDALVLPQGTTMVATGLFVEVPEGYECQVRSRSGLALLGITVFNSPGTVDSDFRGEMKVLLHNAGRSGHHVCMGDRIAQLVFAPVERAQFEVVDELSSTDRGAGGWGSTG
jgi:dUTP diphosphatase